jgi:hypothetical protein
MSLITFPTGSPVAVNVQRVKASAIQQSPFTYAQKIYRHPGAMWVVSFQFTPMRSGGTPNANDFIAFLDNMEGHENTTSVNLSNYTEGISGTDSVTMRLASGSVGWTKNNNNNYSIEFSLIEAISQ